MKKLYFIFLLSIAIVTSCKKADLVDDLEYNIWEEDVSNLISIDSSYAVPVNPSNGDIFIFISFDQNLIDQKWTKIKTIHVEFQRYLFGSPVGNITKKTVSISNGKGIFAPDGTINNANYRFIFQMEFENGRKTALSPVFSITTPPFV